MNVPAVVVVLPLPFVLSVVPAEIVYFFPPACFNGPLDCNENHAQRVKWERRCRKICVTAQTFALQLSANLFGIVLRTSHEQMHMCAQSSCHPNSPVPPRVCSSISFSAPQQFFSSTIFPVYAAALYFRRVPFFVPPPFDLENTKNENEACSCACWTTLTPPARGRSGTRCSSSGTGSRT